MKKISTSLLGILAFLMVYQSTWAQTAMTEKEGILYMLEEEKLAHDVYQVLGEQWDINAFANIQQAEQRHFDMMVALAEQNGLKVPASARKWKVGGFKNKDLQEAYLKMVADGKTSLVAALKVGAHVEEMDINDLKEIMAKTDNKAALETYQYLLNGSENHLRAFTRNLKKQNVDYQPIILSQSYFDEIIASDSKCGEGSKAACCDKGKGEGKGQGKGKGKSKGSCCSKASSK